MRLKLAITALLAVACCASAEDTLNQMTKDAVDMSKRFGEGYKSSQGHTGDKLIEGMIEASTPEADESARQVQRSAIKFIVDPNKERSEKHLQDTLGYAEESFKDVGSSKTPGEEPLFVTPEALSAHDPFDGNANEVIVAHYPFDGNAKEIIAGRNGIPNGVTWVPGKMDSAVRFDGLDDYIDVSALIPAIEGQKEGTISLWVRHSRQSRQPTPSTRYISILGQKYFDLYTQVYGGVSLYVGVPGGELLYFEMPRSKRIDDNEWHHVAYMSAHSGNSLFVDGELIKGMKFMAGSPSTQAWFSDVGRMSLVSIGRRDWHSDKLFFKGEIDDLRIYKRALSASNIRSLYTKATFSPPPPPYNNITPVSHSPLDKFELLEKLKKLKDDDILTDDEFNREKQKILGY